MKNILFLAANPKGTSPLRLDQEAREIGEELRRSQQDDQFNLEQRWAVRPRDIQQAMLDVGPHIVHFSGHGQGKKLVLPPETPCRSGTTLNMPTDTSAKGSEPVFEEGLVFEDERGQAKLVSGVALAGLFELFTGEVECVLLNGCYSAAQALVIAQHVPYVIGMSDVISDKAAIEFAVGFYKALGAGRPIEFAYKLGRNAIQMHGIPEHLTPVLITQADQPIAVVRQPLAPPEFPSGPVSLESRFYIERSLNETRQYQSIQNPGCLLRIMAPDLMGKTSLMARVLDHATQQEYQTAYLSLRDAEQKVLADLNSFLYWFSDRISAELGLEQSISVHWDEQTMGSISNCTNYFEKQILSQLDQPLVLGVDELDRVFPHPDIATDFFGMLRNWFEKGRNHTTWKKLRLVLAYSTEDYSQFRINQSPFNIGEPIKLKELTRPQVQDLITRYDLNWTAKQLDELMAMVGGHPHLLRLAMYYVSNQEVTLEQLLQEAPTEDGIYGDHLHRYWKTLAANPELAETIKQVMSAKAPISVERSHSYQLRSMGLIQYEGNQVRPSCNLYRLYFSQ